MQAHIDHHVDDLIAAGHSRDRALREARRRFGNPSAIREEIYQMNSVPVLEPILRDLRYAVRHYRSVKAGDNHDIGSNGRMWFAVRDRTGKVEAAVYGGTSGVNLVAAENV